jgi:TolB-like protein
MADESKSALAPEQRVGSYVLLERLGAGGLGEVWKARDRRLNRVVALKFISAVRPGSTPATDLLREARAASGLNHPNIITIFEVGEAEGGTYLAMEFVEGETLRQRLNRPPLPLDEALEIAGQMAAGLAAAHKHGIIHRDLKPENIMLRVDGFVKLVDFGLAKVLPWAEPNTSDSTSPVERSETGQLVGTFTYMSPEQARGQQLTPASDVFSSGIVIYEMLTGEHPFRGPTAMDTLNAILSKEPVSAGVRSKAVPQELSNSVARALKKETTERYPSGHELSEELRRVRKLLALPAAASAPEVAKPKPLWWRVAAGLALVLALVGGTWIYRGMSGGGAISGEVRTVAVTTFRFAPDDVRASLLAQGLPEELFIALSRAGVTLASRSSVQELGAITDQRSVGEKLGVDAVLEGTVRSFGTKYRVTVELVSTRTRLVVWTETFTAESDDALTGERTAAEIAAKLREGLSRR